MQITLTKAQVEMILRALEDYEGGFFMFAPLLSSERKTIDTIRDKLRGKK